MMVKEKLTVEIFSDNRKGTNSELNVSRVVTKTVTVSRKSQRVAPGMNPGITPEI